MTLYEQVKEYLLEKIDSYEDITTYIEELEYLLTETIMADGTVEYNTMLTIDKIAENWEEYGTVYKYIEYNLGSAMNPFENAEAFDAEAYCIITSLILNNLQLEEEAEDDKITLTKEVIEKIKKYIKNDTNTYFEY